MSFGPIFRRDDIQKLIWKQWALQKQQVAFETTAGKTKGEHPTYKDMGEDQKKYLKIKTNKTLHTEFQYPITHRQLPFIFSHTDLCMSFRLFSPWFCLCVSPCPSCSSSFFRKDLLICGQRQAVLLLLFLLLFFFLFFPFVKSYFIFICC